jgi:hypothetical protein
LLEHVRDRRRHLDLTRTGLEVGHGARERAAGREYGLDYSG